MKCIRKFSGEGVNLVPPQNLWENNAVKKTKLMLYNSLFIIHVTVKSVPKSYIAVQKQSTSIIKVGMALENWAFIKS